ncbi:unnamed protein product [Miscanthus lutarioriparius]|uniref:DUF4371 domain-containing protein n=1 Tax=Miscanthus lutarioriparius TaxID=422564 RepID=A0A811QXE1_9POAL|nr:unnamed protein product [Miscanthus lutarioriparius]
MLDWYRKKDPKAALVIAENAPGNNQINCPTIQKDLVRACAEETSELIKSEIGDRWFVVLVDEARDASIKEQMAVVVRFVNDKGSVIERFLGLQHVSDTTSSSLKEALVSMLARYGVIYSQVVNIISASCKRKDQLLQKHHDTLVQQLDSGEISPGRGKNKETSLARPGDTRWGTHHKTLVRLMLMWEPVLEVLENISDDGTDGEKTIASGLIEKMESFQFMFILHLMIRVLGTTQDLSQCLQKKNQNIVHAIGLIGSVMRNINAMRENGWDDLLEKTKAFAAKHNIDIPNMEDMIPMRGRSKCRGAKYVTYYHHIHHGIFNVVLDQIICELNNRFPERSTQLLRCVACLDPTNEFANFKIEKLVELAKIYYADFSDYECEKLRTELENFMDEVKHDEEFCSCIDLGGLAEKMVKTDRHTYFPLVYRLIELALILPVATKNRLKEPSLAMNIIKTDGRNKMNDDWMNNSMICYIEWDLFASIEDDKILKRFQGLRNRKINLPPKVPSNSSNFFSTISTREGMKRHDAVVLAPRAQREQGWRQRLGYSQP